MSLRLRQIVLPLARFTLEVDTELENRVTGLFGPSGSGKTSLLDLIAGLRRPSSAFIQLDDQVLTDTANRFVVPARKRRIGYVPQDLALFPHLSVRRNLTYGRCRGNDHDPRFRLEHVVDVLEIGPLLERSVVALSGGEKQRVAIGRALLAVPRLLLLDEPLASLDSKLKARILPYLALVRDEFQLPMLFVSHDLREVEILCAEVLVLEYGRIVDRSQGRKGGLPGPAT